MKKHLFLIILGTSLLFAGCSSLNKRAAAAHQTWTELRTVSKETILPVSCCRTDEQFALYCQSAAYQRALPELYRAFADTAARFTREDESYSAKSGRQRAAFAEVEERFTRLIRANEISRFELLNSLKIYPGSPVKVDDSVLDIEKSALPDMALLEQIALFNFLPARPAVEIIADMRRAHADLLCARELLRVRKNLLYHREQLLAGAGTNLTEREFLQLQIAESKVAVALAGADYAVAQRRFMRSLGTDELDGKAIAAYRKLIDEAEVNAAGEAASR